MNEIGVMLASVAVTFAFSLFLFKTYRALHSSANTEEA